MESELEGIFFTNILDKSVDYDERITPTVPLKILWILVVDLARTYSTNKDLL